MDEYKGVTHTIVEMLARNKIQAVPRNRDTKRTELKYVARPDDDRQGEIPTRQQENQKKKVDEAEVTPEPGQLAGPDPSKEKKPKKLEIEDIGKQKPTQVVVNPELDNTPNIFASTEVKGDLVTEETIEKVHAALKNSGFHKKDDKWHFPGVMTQKHVDKLHDEMTKAGMERSPGHSTISWFHRRNKILASVGGKTGEHYHASVRTWNEETISEEKPDEKSRKEAEHIANFVKQLQGKTIGGFKVTGNLTPEHIRQGAEIRARMNRLNKEETVNEISDAAKSEYRKKSFKSFKSHSWKAFGNELTGFGEPSEKHIKKMFDRAHGTARSYGLKGIGRQKAVNAAMGNVKESRVNDFNSVSIQYQTKGGNWITARKTSESPSDIMLAMRTVQKTYSSNRVRAIGAKGFVLDFQPIDPSDIATESLSEDHKVISTYTPKNPDYKGDKWELSDRGTYHSIVKTHQDGKSLKNEWGGYGSSYNGAPKYMAKKWKDIQTHHDRKTSTGEWGVHKAFKEETSVKDLKKARDRTANAWYDNKPKSLKSFKQVSKALRKKEVKESGELALLAGWAALHAARRGYTKYQEIKGDKKMTGLQKAKHVGIAAIGEPVHDFQAARDQIWGKKKPKPAVSEGNVIDKTISDVKKEWPKTTAIVDNLRTEYKKATVLSPGLSNWAGQKDMLSPKITTDYMAKNKIKETVDNIVSEILTYKNSASLRARDAVAQADAAAAQAQQAQAQAQQQPPQQKKKQPPVQESHTYTGAQQARQVHTQRASWLKNQPGQKHKAEREDQAAQAATRVMNKRRAKGIGRGYVAGPHLMKRGSLQSFGEAKNTRHTGIEVEEPKFSQSIQRVAAHTKWNADAVHTYRHADGSKTKVDQELGTKIYDKINNTPSRYKARLVQHIHKSADNLKRALDKDK